MSNYQDSLRNLFALCPNARTTVILKLAAAPSHMGWKNVANNVQRRLNIDSDTMDLFSKGDAITAAGWLVSVTENATKPLTVGEFVVALDTNAEIKDVVYQAVMEAQCTQQKTSGKTISSSLDAMQREQQAALRAQQAMIRDQQAAERAQQAAERDQQAAERAQQAAERDQQAAMRAQQAEIRAQQVAMRDQQVAARDQLIAMLAQQAAMQEYQYQAEVRAREFMAREKAERETAGRAATARAAAEREAAEHETKAYDASIREALEREAKAREAAAREAAARAVADLGQFADPCYNVLIREACKMSKTWSLIAKKLAVAKRGNWKEVAQNLASRPEFSYMDEEIQLWEVSYAAEKAAQEFLATWKAGRGTTVALFLWAVHKAGNDEVEQIVKDLVTPPQLAPQPAPQPVHQPATMEIEVGKCVICIDQKAVFAIIPCGHLTHCKSCKGVDTSGVCPICRGKADLYQPIFFQ